MREHGKPCPDCGLVHEAAHDEMTDALVEYSRHLKQIGPAAEEFLGHLVDVAREHRLKPHVFIAIVVANMARRVDKQLCAPEDMPQMNFDGSTIKMAYAFGDLMKPGSGLVQVNEEGHALAESLMNVLRVAARNRNGGPEA